jgi:hypothetical protein
MAIGSPTIPVPGIPTPMAFLMMLALSLASIFSGRQPNFSVAFAVQSATHVGSVHPMAGTTSWCISAMMRSRVCLSIMLLIPFMPAKVRISEKKTKRFLIFLERKYFRAYFKSTKS